jgi:broad specificity phosphatase PhoE
MKIAILRHAESEKNINKSFSHDSHSEPITSLGCDQALKIGQSLFLYCQQNYLTNVQIHSSKSQRANSTATIIANCFGVGFKEHPEFRSITTDKHLMGKTEDEVKQADPVFTTQLELYRSGLFNAYHYQTVANNLKNGEYERQVIDKFYEILNDAEEGMIVYILHHSSITAVLIEIARQSCYYPNDYYGHVKADVGNLYLLDYSKKKFRFDLVNHKPPIIAEELI